MGATYVHMPSVRAEGKIWIAKLLLMKFLKFPPTLLAVVGINESCMEEKERIDFRSLNFSFELHVSFAATRDGFQLECDTEREWNWLDSGRTSLIFLQLFLYTMQKLAMPNKTIFVNITNHQSINQSFRKNQLFIRVFKASLYGSMRFKLKSI